MSPPRTFRIATGPGRVASVVFGVYGVVLVAFLTLSGVSALVTGRVVAGLLLLAVAVVLAVLDVRQLRQRRAGGQSSGPELRMGDVGVTVVQPRPGGVAAAHLAWTDVVAVVASPMRETLGSPLYVRFMPTHPHAVQLDADHFGESLLAKGSVVWVVPGNAQRLVRSALAEVAAHRPDLRIVDSIRGADGNGSR